MKGNGELAETHVTPFICGPETTPQAFIVAGSVGDVLSGLGRPIFPENLTHRINVILAVHNDLIVFSWHTGPRHAYSLRKSGLKAN